MAKRILITGVGGVLGSAMFSVSQAAGYDVIGAGRASLAPEDIFDLVAQHKPAIVINCASDTDVESAEDNPDRSWAANAILPGLLAAGARRHGALIVHYSSTGCFGNWADRPYTDFDPLRPTTVFHKAKVEGDKRVWAETSNALILRTSWLFGGNPGHNKNFVWHRLQEARATACLLADTNQRGNPTFAGDLASQTLNLIARGITGTYNCVGHHVATRFEYVAEIVKCSGLPCSVRPAPPGHFRRRASVSPNESAVNNALELLGVNEMPDWRDPMKKLVASLVPLLLERT